MGTRRRSDEYVTGAFLAEAVVIHACASALRDSTRDPLRG